MTVWALWITLFIGGVYFGVLRVSKKDRAARFRDPDINRRFEAYAREIYRDDRRL